MRARAESDLSPAIAEADAKNAGRWSRETLVVTILAGVACLLWIAQWWGVAPYALSAVAIGTWFSIGSRRWGQALAAGTVAIAWATVVLAAQTISPLISVDPRTASSAAIVVVTIAVVPFSHRTRPDASRELRASLLVAPAAGGVAWLLGLAVGLGTERGGLAWAMYRDSTMDLWVMRQIVEYGGIPSLGRLFIAQPPPHGLSVGLTDPAVSIAASEDSAAAFLAGHAAHWSLQLVMASYLAAVVTMEIARRSSSSRWHRGVVVLSGACVSLLMVSYPIAGIPMDLGQTNVPMLIVLLLASISACLGASGRRALLALAVLGAAAGIIVAAWPVLAAVPVALAALMAYQLRRLRLPRDTVLAWSLAGVVPFAWSMIIYGWPTIYWLLKAPGTYAQQLATTSTYENPGHWESYVNPYSVPLASVLAVCIAVMGGWALKRHRRVASIALVVLAALSAGMAVALVALGDVPETLPYFPAKYLFIATIIMVPVAVGLALGLFGMPGMSRILALGAVIALGLAASFTPRPHDASPWALTPIMVANGDHFGSHEDVVAPFVANASSSALRLPWRLNPPHDTTVALMMSAIGPDVDSVLLQPMRSVLRSERGDFGADVACKLAEADVRPVVLLTADDGLSDEIDALCPDLGIDVRLVSDR